MSASTGRDRRVPVTLVQGWLDDSAWTLGVRLASAVPGAVLLHGGEPSGEVPPAVEVHRVEEEVGERSPGCACCALRLDLLDRLGLLARRNRPPAHVIVVGRPGTDLATAVVTLLDDLELRRNIRLAGVVACLDGPSLSAAIGSGVDDPWPSSALLDATMLADAVWISAATSLTARGIQQAAWMARCVNPHAWVDATSAPATDHLLSLDAWTPDASADRAAAGWPPAFVLDTNDRPTGLRTGTTVLAAEGTLDPQRLQRWIRHLHGTAGSRLLRLDAVLAVAGTEHRVNAVGCRTALRTRAARRWEPGEERTSTVRIIGRDLDLGALADELVLCAV